MYENHWQLKTRPFENWGDGELYYPSEVHQTALLKLRYAIESRRAVMVIGGDSGMGKSMLVDRLIEQLPDESAPAIKVGFPQLPSDQLIGYVADRLTGIPGEASEPARLTLARLEAFFNENNAAGQHAVVFVDEAHLLSPGDQLETLRLLLNLGQPNGQSESNWSLVLVGDATLVNLVERNRAFDERISAKCLLHRFTPDQTAAYLQHRLKVAGGNADEIFTRDAIEALHHRSGGIPRRINRLADLALMVGFAEELNALSAEHVDGVHQELVGAN